MRILVGITGSVASIKLLSLVEDLQREVGKASNNAIVEVQVIATANALRFLPSLETISDIRIHTDSDEWSVFIQVSLIFILNYN